MSEPVIPPPTESDLTLDPVTVYRRVWRYDGVRVDLVQSMCRRWYAAESTLSAARGWAAELEAERDASKKRFAALDREEAWKSRLRRALDSCRRQVGRLVQSDPDDDEYEEELPLWWRELDALLADPAADPGGGP